MDSCSTCICYFEKEGDGYGSCRFNAPMGISAAFEGVPLKAMWPAILYPRLEWCHRHRKKGGIYEKRAEPQD